MRISPEMTVAMSASVPSPSTITIVRSWRWSPRRHRTDRDGAYERVLTDAMAGDPTLFARQDYVEEAWRIVDPILSNQSPVIPYDQHTWGPSEDGITPPGGWDDPKPELSDDFRIVSH